MAVTDYHVSLIPKECAVEHVIGWISKYLLAFSQAMVIFPKKKICVFAFTKKKICVFAFIYTFISYDHISQEKSLNLYFYLYICKLHRLNSLFLNLVV